MNVEHKTCGGGNEYASKTQANVNSWLAGIAAALGIANGGGCGNGNIVNRLLGGNGGSGCGNGGFDAAALLAMLNAGNNCCGPGVNRYEAQQSARVSELEAERYSDNKADALKENLLRDWLKPLSDRAAEQMAKEAKMEAEIVCLKQTTELKLQLAQKEIELARQEAKCCCDKTNMRIDCLAEKVDGITKTVIPADAVEKAA